MKMFLGIFLLFGVAGCLAEPYTRYRATLYNPTSHSVKILSYKNGIVNSTDTIVLEPNTNFQIAYGTELGKNTRPGFSSGYFGSPKDSNVVIFDNTYTITHYANTPDSLASRYYLFTSLRNIANPNSYEFEIVDDRGDINDHKYYFTEQDYLDAKD
jgi:hypothetical protein